MNNCNKVSTAKSGGFTLLELMIVVAIIGVLVTVFLTSAKNVTEAARATKCLANLHSLATAANTYSMRSGWFPLAGSREWFDMGNSDMIYGEHPGWISWLSNPDKFNVKNGNSEGPTSFVHIDNCPFYGTDNEEDAEYAVTNGTLWTSLGRNMDVYRCPTHVKYRREHGKKNTTWSYVMNAYFGYDWSDGSEATHSKQLEPGNIKNGQLGVRTDLLLMFAELPIRRMSVGSDDDGEIDEGGSGDTRSDCVLQYKANINGENFNPMWDGTAESIGFNHKVGKRYCAHVAFADGHVEKLSGATGGRLSYEEVTALLCEGRELYFDGEGYYPPDNDISH